MVPYSRAQPLGALLRAAAAPGGSNCIRDAFDTPPHPPFHPPRVCFKKLVKGFLSKCLISSPTALGLLMKFKLVWVLGFFFFPP